MNPLTDLKDDLKDKYLIPKIEGRHLVIRENITSPYYAHVLFAEISLDIHHQAIWSIRDLVRNIEKERLAEDVQSPSSTRLTEGIRHAIHVSETCETTVHMVQAMLSAHELWLQQNTFPAYQPPVISTQPNKTAGHLNRIIPNLTNRHISSRLRHALSGLRTLQQRASSNHARLNSEIQLSTNTFSQSISIAAQEDSRIMKSLTYLGVIFLPATFMSALFSTSFFNTTNDTGEWYLHTDRFWIFWAVTVPVTLLAAGGMWAWSKFADSGGGGGKVVIYNSNTKVNTGLGTGGTGTGAGAVAVTAGGNDGGERKGTWGMGMRMGMGMKRRSTISYSWTTAKKKPGSGPGDEDGLGKS